jgi:hypothetical protein
LNALPTFKAANALETALEQARSGVIPIRDFIAKLLESQVFVLLDKAVEPDGVWDNSAAPMVLSSPSGSPMLAVFTAPERSTHSPHRLPEYAFGLLIAFRWLLKGIEPDVGLVINPGSAVGLEIPASGVIRIRAEIAPVKPDTN